LQFFFCILYKNVSYATGKGSLHSAASHVKYYTEEGSTKVEIQYAGKTFQKLLKNSGGKGDSICISPYLVNW
jgi:hypothetical protein